MAMVNDQQSTVYPKSHVGFDSITQQIEKKLLKRGFQFNVICVGKKSLPVCMADRNRRRSPLKTPTYHQTWATCDSKQLVV